VGHWPSTDLLEGVVEFLPTVEDARMNVHLVFNVVLQEVAHVVDVADVAPLAPPTQDKTGDARTHARAREGQRRGEANGTSRTKRLSRSQMEMMTVRSRSVSLPAAFLPAPQSSRPLDTACIVR
jgi:hypothetical protein